jgi:hypothetical protein
VCLAEATMKTRRKDAENRVIQRRSLIMYLKIVNSGSDRLVGRLVDISPDGMTVISESDFVVNEIFHLKLLIPLPIEGRTYVEFNAKCLHSRVDSHSGYFYSGFQLIHPDLSNVGLIEKLISRYGFKDNQED